MHNHYDLILFIKILFENSINETEIWLKCIMCTWDSGIQQDIFSKTFTDISFFNCPRVALGSQFLDPVVEQLAFAAESQETIVKGGKKITLRVSMYQNGLFRYSPSMAVLKTWGTFSNVEDSHALNRTLDKMTFRGLLQPIFFLFLWSLNGLGIPD